MDTVLVAAPALVRARYLNVYRLAAYTLVLYALGHTLGAVIRTPHFGLESDGVVAAMKDVHVLASGYDCTWYGFYRGFGIFVTVYFLFSAALAWHVGGMRTRERAAFAPIMWALFASHAISIVTASLYFFGVPIVFSTLVTLLLGIGCLKDLYAARTAPAH
jgi:hypothetical protein